MEYILEKIIQEEDLKSNFSGLDYNSKIDLIKLELSQKYDIHFLEDTENKNVDGRISLIKKYVKNENFQKKIFGEVMTPIDEVIIPMLNLIPKEVWSNPTLKWLDPCSGIGNYGSVVIKKLMDGLINWEPDKNKRYNHIVENMFFCCELQTKNVFIKNIIFNSYINVYHGDFLSEKFNYFALKNWGISKFDIILGNPPYNNTSTGSNGSRDLWDKFVFKSIKILKDNGFLCFVHPPKWRMPESKLFKTFKENNLIHLNINSKEKGIKTFKAKTRYDFYCLQKCEYNGITTIIDENEKEVKINILEWDWIPNYEFDLIKKIVSSNGEEKCSIIYDRSIYGNDKPWMTKHKTETNYLPCVYGMYNDYSCSFLYSSENKGHFGVPKIILGIGEKLYPLTDPNGEYGMTNNCFAIKIDNILNINYIKSKIESESFKKIIKATKWNSFQTNYKMFKSFKKDFWLYI